MITSEIVTDYVNASIDEFNKKLVLYKNNIITMAPPSFEKPLNDFKGGERVKIPLWVMSNNNEYGVVLRQRKYFGQYKLNDLINTWGKNAEGEVARQIINQITNSIYSSMIKMLDAAIPSENIHDVSAASETIVTIDKKIELRDMNEDLQVLICHSKVFRDLKRISYSDYSSAVLVDGNIQNGIRLYIAGGRYVWVTDKCPVDTTIEGCYKYTSFLIGLHQLFVAVQGGFEFEISRFLSKDLTEMLASINYVLHLNGVSWKPTAPTNPTMVDFETSANWELGVSSAEMIKAIKIVSN